MNRGKIIFAGALIVIAGLCAYLFLRGSGNNNSDAELTLHCAAGLRKPVQEIIASYKAEFGVTIRPNFGPSGGLESQIKAGAGGDIYLPADVSYVTRMQKEGMAREAIPVARLTAGIAVAKGNPKNIRSLADLADPNVKVSIANVEAAVGKFTQKVLVEAGQWDAITGGDVVFKPTVNAVAEDVAIEAVDAGIAWDAVVKQFGDKLDFVAVPEFSKRTKNSTACILEASSAPTEALRFVRYLAASDKGLKIFKKHHFEIVDGDMWERTPEIKVFAGSMLRPAIEKAMKKFELREGVRISSEFEGCGTLVGMMLAGTHPDAYFSCDLSYLDKVKNEFQGDSVVVASNEMVILVPKGNRRGIRKPADMGRSNGESKVGLCDPDKSALGGLSNALLDRLELLNDILPNVITRASKGDELVNQVQVGALDAAIVYRSNANASPEIAETCDIVEIGAADAIARQPFAVGRDSRFKHLIGRLRDALTTAESQSNFERLGFSWEAGKP